MPVAFEGACWHHQVLGADHVAVDELTGMTAIGGKVGCTGTFVVAQAIGVPATAGVTARYACW